MNKEYILPGSILLSAILISGSIIFTSDVSMVRSDAPRQVAQVAAAVNNHQAPQPPNDSNNVAKVSQNDHIRGNVNADVKVIEFSDLECPFCQRFHETMDQVMDKYSGNEVAWVYRHFPLENIHPLARNAAVASECVAEFGGNDAFWSYVDQIFSGEKLTSSVISEAAQMAGVGEEQLETCLESEKYDSIVTSHIQDGSKSGARGTPYSIIVGPDGNTFAVSGAQPFSVIDSVIQLALEG